MSLVYDKAKLEEMSKFTDQTVEKLCKDLGFHYTYLQEEILKITNVYQGWGLWTKHNGDKKSDCIIGRTITKLLITELEKTTEITAAHQLHTACPDGNNWRELIDARINELCLIDFYKRKDTMSISNAQWLLGLCPEVGDSTQIITDWINDQIEKRIPNIKTISEGIELWNICDKRIPKSKRNEKPKISKGVRNARKIETKLGKMRREVNKMKDKKEILKFYGSLPEKNFEQLKILLMMQIYKLP